MRDRRIRVVLNESAGTATFEVVATDEDGEVYVVADNEGDPLVAEIDGACFLEEVSMFITRMTVLHAYASVLTMDVHGKAVEVPVDTASIIVDDGAAGIEIVRKPAAQGYHDMVRAAERVLNALPENTGVTFR